MVPVGEGRDARVLVLVLVLATEAPRSSVPADRVCIMLG